MSTLTATHRALIPACDVKPGWLILAAGNDGDGPLWLQVASVATVGPIGTILLFVDRTCEFYPATAIVTATALHGAVA